jgi:Kef-type K+ transport system membrane component KefB
METMHNSSTGVMSNSSIFAMAAESHKPIYSGGTPLYDPISILLVQALLIILLSRALHFILHRLFKSPIVVSEVLAGMILGSGLNDKTYTESIWSLESTKLLYTVSQFGIVLFVFVNGLELDASLLFKAKKTVVITGLAVFLLPLFAAIGVSWYLYSILGDITITPYAVEKGPFIFYTAFCMAVTGLPVVNRMLANSKLFNTAAGDLSAQITNFNALISWLVLMYLIPYAENSRYPLYALGIFGTLIGLFVVSWWFLHKTMAIISHMGTVSESLSQLAVLLTFCIVFLFSWFTQAMGANAIFGALLIGLVTPHDHQFAIKIAEKMEDILMILFVPLYFGLIGWFTNIAFYR